MRLPSSPMTSPIVPDELLGCWRRQWIQFADGSRDNTSFVVWLQLPSRMADLRLSAAALALAGRGFDELSVEEVRELADGDSSSGATTCGAPVVGDDGIRRAVAEWTSAVAVQPTSAFPEPGLLEWNDDATVLIERAPSGAYVEEWHLVPGSRGPSSHQPLGDGGELFSTGEVAMLVHDRRTAAARVSRLTEIASRTDLERALGCEFSFARRRVDTTSAEAWVIEVSTLPWRVGATVVRSVTDAGQ